MSLPFLHTSALFMEVFSKPVSGTRYSCYHSDVSHHLTVFYPCTIPAQVRSTIVPTILPMEGGTGLKSSKEVGTNKPLKGLKAWCGHPGGGQMSSAEMTIAGCSSSPLLSPVAGFLGWLHH